MSKVLNVAITTVMVMAVILALTGFAMSEGAPAPKLDSDVTASITDVIQNGHYIVNGSQTIVNGSIVNGSGTEVPYPTFEQIYRDRSVILVYNEGTCVVKGHVDNWNTSRWLSGAVYFGYENGTTGASEYPFANPIGTNPYDNITGAGYFMNMTDAAGGYSCSRDFVATIHTGNNTSLPLRQVIQGDDGMFYYDDDYATLTNPHTSRPVDVIQVWAIDQDNTPIVINTSTQSNNPILLGLMLVANAASLSDREAYSDVDLDNINRVVMTPPNDGTPDAGDNGTVTPVAPHVVITIPQGDMSDGTAIYDSRNGTWTFSRPDLYNWLDIGLLLRLVGLA